MTVAESQVVSLRSEPPAVVGAEAGATTVFVVEELTAIRELVANFINRLEGFRVVGTSGNRIEAECECARLKPQIAVVDWLLLSDVSGVNLAEALRKSSSGTKVVIFSAANEAHFVNDAIAAGTLDLRGDRKLARAFFRLFSRPKPTTTGS